MEGTLDTILGKNQSAAIDNRTILHTLSTIPIIIDIPNKLKKNFLYNICTFSQKYL